MIKLIFLFVFLSAAASAVFAQNEQAPVAEKSIAYNNWTYKNVVTGEDVSLRGAAAGLKFMMVVYFAPWCPNWRRDAPFVQRLYDKYKSAGFGVVAVGEYGTVDAMKSNLQLLKITFPAVYESQSREDRKKTLHYSYRTAAGDTRDWGSPWYIFLEPEKFKKGGETVTTRASVVNGEMFGAEVEKLIRNKLGLGAEKAGEAASEAKTEVCDPARTAAKIKVPANQR